MMKDFVNKVFNEDCLDTMSRMPDDCIDLVVTSPPYDNLRKYGQSVYGCMPSFMKSFPSIAKELYRIMAPGGVVVWVVSDQSVNGSETLNSWRQLIHFVDVVGFRAHDTMVFEKKNYFPTRHNRYEQAWEPMFVLAKGAPKTFSPLTIPCVEAGKIRKWNDKETGAANSKQAKSARYRNGRITKTREKKYRPNIWAYASGSHMSTNPIAHKHPAIFPEALAGDHILSWSNPGDFVYDLFAGSGTTLYMAKKLGRKYIGSEISSEYVDGIIKPRLSELLDFGGTE